MNILTDYPIIPGITFLLIVFFFGYQVRLFLKERRKAKAPKVPNITVRTAGVQPAKLVIPDLQKQVTQKNADPKKKYGPITQMLSVLVLLLVVVSTMGIVYVYRNQNFTTVPRASGPSPTSPLLPVVSLSPTQTVTEPLISAPLSPTSAIPSITARPTATFLAQNVTTTAPSQIPSLTSAPTASASRISPTTTAVVVTGSLSPSPQTPSFTSPSPTPSNPTLTFINSPTPVLIARISGSISPTSSSIKPTGMLTTSPVPTQKSVSTQTSIPEAGIPWYLGVFVIGSVIFLAIGFIW